jgi:hypothetical protein
MSKAVLVTDYKVLQFSRRPVKAGNSWSSDSKFGSLTVDRKVTTVTVDNAVRIK